VANLSASAYTSDYTSPERGKRLTLAESALGSQFGCPKFPLHLVWGRVSLTGVAAAVIVVERRCTQGSAIADLRIHETPHAKLSSPRRSSSPRR
jgi:hypothetical protein